MRIYNKSDQTEVYSMPVDPHVHESAGQYTFSDDFVLSEVNGIAANSDWIFEATVWGHDEGVSEVSEQVEFHVQ